MKELTIEEKAKRYDEAIEKFDVILNLNTVKESGTIFADDVRKILPELKKSEDERIREEIIKYFKKYQALSLGDYNVQDILAWLEKQGEQKPAVIIPKFKIGDVMRTLQEAKDGITDGLPVVISVNKDCYDCTNELIFIKDQGNYEYPPINRKQNTAI